MTTKDLITYLNQFPPNAKILFYDKRKRLYLDYITKTDMYKYDEEYYETASEFYCALENKCVDKKMILFLIENAEKTSVTEVQLF